MSIWPVKNYLENSYSNRNSTSKYQHAEKPFLHKFKNKDSWDEVKKVIEETEAQENVSIE